MLELKPVFVLRNGCFNSIFPGVKNLMNTAMNRKLILILFGLNALVTFKVLGQKEVYFLPFIDSSGTEKLVGYKNQSGETVIPAKYQLLFYIDTLREINHSQMTVPNVVAVKQSNSDYFLPFILSKESVYPENGWQRFEKTGRMGFIDQKNKVVVPAQYDFVTPFNKGFAEFYNGIEKIYVDGSWYWGGEIQRQGFITLDGLEFSTREVKLYENGNIKEEAYRWTEPASCRSRIKTITYDETGKVRGHYLYATKPDCSQEYRSKYLFNVFGDTMHSENETVKGLNGLYRLGHYDYCYEDTAKIFIWSVIRSQWKNDTLLDFISSDLVFLDEKYNRISEKKMIRKINTKNLDWTYTYFPQEIRNKSGAPITFLIHPMVEDLNDKDRLEKTRKKFLKHWVSHPLNRLIYYSDSMSILRVDDSGMYSAEIKLSEKESKQISRLMHSQGKYAGTIEKPEEYTIRLTSYNEDLASTFLWLSKDSGNISVEAGNNHVILLKSTRKLKRLAKKLAKTFPD
jgi:hypothetical protein